MLSLSPLTRGLQSHSSTPVSDECFHLPARRMSPSTFGSIPLWKKAPTFPQPPLSVAIC